MTLRSPGVAILWETWRVTRGEAAWKLAGGTIGGLAALGLHAAVAPTGDPRAYESVTDLGAAMAMTILVLPHLVGWPSMARLTGGRPGFPLHLHYARPVRTIVLVGLPMAYLTAVSSAIYLVSALLLRMASGHAFPLLPVAAWIAALTMIFLAGRWSTRIKSVPVATAVFAVTNAWAISVERLTAVEIPNTFDWPPRLWPTLFDWPRTDYTWAALIGLVSVRFTVAMVALQRRGEDLVAIAAAPFPPVSRGGLWERLIDVFRIPCPTASAARAQMWSDLRADGLPVLAIGVTLALLILLVSSVSGPIDAAVNANPSVSCPIGECFYARPWPLLMTPLSLITVLVLAGNAFGVRRRQGRTYVSAFEATQAHGTAHMAALKLLVKSVCVLAALLAIGLSAWLSMPLLGDAVFIQVWGVPLDSQLSVVNEAVAALAAHEQLALVVVAAAGVVLWVAAFAVLGALRTRYSRRVNIAALLALLYGLGLGLLALARLRGIGPDIPPGAIVRGTSWVAASAMAIVTAYVFWTALAEQLLTRRQAGVVLLAAAGVGAAWATVLRAAGVALTNVPAVDAVRMLLPALLLLTVSVLAPWSLSRVRHT